MDSGRAMLVQGFKKELQLYEETSVLKSFLLCKQSNSMTCLKFDNVVLFLGHLHYGLSAGQKQVYFMVKYRTSRVPGRFDRVV